MIDRRATASCTAREPAHGNGPGARAAWWATCAVGAVAPLLGCGSPNPRIFDATEQARGMPSAELGNTMTEQEKIQAIITAVRKSGHVFVHDGIVRDGAATADKLQLLLERDPVGVRSAREFIDRLAAPERTDEDPDRVQLAKTEEHLPKAHAAEDLRVENDFVPARYWYLVRLAELEGRPPPPAPPGEQREAEVHARRLLILDALAIIEHSELKFVAPPRPGPQKPALVMAGGTSTGPKRKPKRKEYSGVQFADMLRKKWEFLGADIEDLDTFIDEIASDSFASMVRYRVVLEDGHEEDFGAWLRAQLGTETAKLAQGGAP
jgi:hypothetical protein